MKTKEEIQVSLKYEKKWEREAKDIEEALIHHGWKEALEWVLKDSKIFSGNITLGDE